MKSWLTGSPSNTPPQSKDPTALLRGTSLLAYHTISQRSPPQEVPFPGSATSC